MTYEAKLNNPVQIQLIGNLKQVKLSSSDEVYPLESGIILGGKHQGFILFVDSQQGIKEITYPTVGSIEGIGLVDNKVKIFERGKLFPWEFSKEGTLLRNVDEFEIDDDYNKERMIMENASLFGGDFLIYKPVKILIGEDYATNTILSDCEGHHDYPVYPGIMIGDIHFGFVLVTKTKDGYREEVYPTQGRIEAIGEKDDDSHSIKIFEKGKYSPWLFTSRGKLISEASYNPYSRIDSEDVHKKDDPNEVKAKQKVIE